MIQSRVCIFQLKVCCMTAIAIGAVGACKADKIARCPACTDPDYVRYRAVAVLKVLPGTK